MRVVVYSPPMLTTNEKIVRCRLCPRLREHCARVAREKRSAFRLERYWGKPVPGFGDPRAGLFVFGLAPAAHGANRTGRMFTGDRSGDWLYRALHKAGFASQALSRNRGDGLVLRNAWVSAAAHCAPPGNKPSREELALCARHLRAELAELRELKVFLALGGIAFDALWKELGAGVKKPRFAHGGEQALGGGRTLLLSYHPSQQNTFTGRLTEPMFDQVFDRARRLLSPS